MKLARTIVFWIHLGVGCVAGLVILVMSFTGVVLAFERQVNAWADAPAMRQAQSATTPRVSLDAAVTSLVARGNAVPDQLVMHKERSAPIEARYGREKTLLLDPSTGDVVGQPSERTRAFFSFVERVHRSMGLGMQNALGRGLTGAGNLVFLGLLISGLYLWLPKLWSWTAIRSRLWFRGGLQGRAREWNWHNALGIWTAIPLLFIVATGVIMSYPWASNLLFTMTGSPLPVRGGWRGEGRPHRSPEGGARTGASRTQYRTLDDVEAAAAEQVPGWKTMTLEVPQGEAKTLNVAVDLSVGGQPEKASQLTINRTTGHVDAVKSFSSNSLGSRLRAWARFTHTGEEFGLVGQIIAALASLGGVLLVWTGLSMALRRGLGWIARSRRSAKETGREAVEAAS